MYLYLYTIVIVVSASGTNSIGKQSSNVVENIDNATFSLSTAVIATSMKIANAQQRLSTQKSIRYKRRSTFRHLICNSSNKFTMHALAEAQNELLSGASCR